MKGPLRFVAQAALYVPLMALIGYFSRAPSFVHLPADQALVRVSIAHAAERRLACRERSAEELAKLPPNMRAGQDCPRERATQYFELAIDGSTVWSAEAPPAGLQRDGLGTLYHRLPVPAGTHRVEARLRDRAGEGFSHRHEETLTLAGGDALLVDFNEARGALEFRR